MLHMEMRRSGPLPDPAELQTYDLLVPGAADRIIGEFEKQSDHRRGLEKVTVEGTERRAGLGQVLAATIVILAVVLGFVAVIMGQPVAGAAIAAAALGSAALVYVIGGRPPKAE